MFESPFALLIESLDLPSPEFKIMSPYILSLIYLCATFAGLLAGSILIFYRKPEFYRYNYLLGISFILSSLAISAGFLYLSDLIYQVVHMYRTGNALILLALPFSYLYIRNTVRKNGSKWVIALLFVPFIFYVIDFLPFFLSTPQEKLQIITDSKNELVNSNSFSEGWITPPWFQLYMRPIFMFVIWSLQLLELLRLKPRGPYEVDNKAWLNWIWMYQFNQTFYWLPSLLFFTIEIDANIRDFVTSIPMGFFVVINIFLFFNPTILYGRNENSEKVQKRNNPEALNENESVSNDSESTSLQLSDERIAAISGKLEEVVKNSGAYLNQGYSLHNLATDVNESPRNVSTVLNTTLDTNFSEYINRFRIEHSIHLIEKGEHKTKTIEALGYECGFRNRTSFITAFKRYTDVTPSKFIKSRNQQSATSDTE